MVVASRSTVTRVRQVLFPEDPKMSKTYRTLCDLAVTPQGAGRS
jgi:hypothetical protein